MRRKLLTKLILCFIVTAISMFALLNTYSVRQLEKQLTERKKDILYREASLIATEYVSNYYKSMSSLSDMVIQLKTIDIFLDTRIWVVNNEGFIIADTHNSAVGLNINRIDPEYLNGVFHENLYFKGIFPESMLSVVQVVTDNYALKGYICIHISMKSIKEESIFFTDFFNIGYLIFLVILFFVFAIIYYITVIPLRKIICIVKEYSSGNFDCSVKIRTHDEFFELEGAVQYMAQELKNLDEYQKKFVANISHDFRSPLTSIKGYIEAILDGTIPYDMQGKYMDIILVETERLTKLTTNLLTLNNFENNGVLLDIVTFDINAVIKNTAASFEGGCLKKKLTLNLIFPSKEVYVDADFDKIQQVFYNLIDNAIKFSNSDSSIDVTVEEKGTKIFITVKDHGIGIPKESIKKVWERFYKTDVSRGKDKKGTGLGLSITKEIITAHGENINVVSTEGVGTEFIFSLPRADIE